MPIFPSRLLLKFTKPTSKKLKLHHCHLSSIENQNHNLRLDRLITIKKKLKKKNYTNVKIWHEIMPHENLIKCH